MGLEELGLTGNCRFSALVERTGSGVQCCLQRFDSERGFSTLLDERDGGNFVAPSADGTPGTQRCLENTNVLGTRFEVSTGAIRVLARAPRFSFHGRVSPRWSDMP